MFGDISNWWGEGYISGRSWPSFALRLVFLYALLTFCCWDELRYRKSSVELTANVIWVRPYLTEGKQLVRYTFAHPVTGSRQTNTLIIPNNARPSDKTVTIQYIPGDFPQSRLAAQSNPFVVTIFLGINIVFLTIALGYAGYIAWKFNHDPQSHLTPQQRGIERFNRRRKVEQQIHRYR